MMNSLRGSLVIFDMYGPRPIFSLDDASATSGEDEQRPTTVYKIVDLKAKMI